MSIVVVTTGGTLDKVYFDAKSEFQVGEPCAGAVLEEARVTVPWRQVECLRKDSLEMTAADRDVLRACIEAQPEPRVVVTHGTDTMPETAEALRCLDGRTVVLTGALAPARMRESDAPFNLGFALAAVQLLDPGVYVAIQGRVFAAGTVRKDRRTGRFESPS